MSEDTKKSDYGYIDGYIIDSCEHNIDFRHCELGFSCCDGTGCGCYDPIDKEVL